jgi:hypothetical protein
MQVENCKERNMNPILHLQRLTLIASRKDVNMVLISTASVICPTTMAAYGLRNLEME